MTQATMSLREAIQQQRSQSSQRNGKTSEHTPAEYNRRKNAFVAAVLAHPTPVVRAAAVALATVPTTALVKQFQVERDSSVLTAILFNPRLPIKSVIAFMDDPRCEMVNENRELTTFIVNRLRKETAQQTS